MHGFAFFSGDYGTGAVIASERGVAEVIPPFGGRTAAELQAGIISRYPDARLDSGYAKAAADELDAYFHGHLKSFSVPLDLRHLSGFAAQVCRYVIEIPYGEVRSYGQVAAAVGSARAARGVGAVMAANRLPIIIPCHRVVAADGSMRGYSAAGGVVTKRELLVMEGVSLG